MSMLLDKNYGTLGKVLVITNSHVKYKIKSIHTGLKVMNNVYKVFVTGGLTDGQINK